jgi:hypothetical protein
MNFARRVAFIGLFGALGCSGLAETGYQVKPERSRCMKMTRFHRTLSAAVGGLKVGLLRAPPNVY